MRKFRKSPASVFDKTWKTSFWTHFEIFWFQNYNKRNFLKKSGSVTFYAKSQFFYEQTRFSWDLHFVGPVVYFKWGICESL